MINIRPMMRVPGDTNLCCTKTAPGGGEATTTGKRRRGLDALRTGGRLISGGLHDVLRQCESEEVGEDTDKLLPVLLPEQVVDRTQAITLKISGAQLGWPWI